MADILDRLTPAEWARVDAILRRPVAIDVIDRKFPMQAAFIEHPARLKLLLCTRRGGKSFGDGLYLVREALTHPNVSCLYLGLTRESAKRIMWDPVFRAINDRFGLGLDFKVAELAIRFPNGSVIYLLGVDSNEDEKRKAFGQKYRCVVVDEAALYTINLDELVYSVLQPATADEQGTICLTGMPSNIKHGLFYRLTLDQDPGEPGTFTAIDQQHGAIWTGWRWSGMDNPYMRDKFAAEIATKRAVNPLIDQTPIFQQEYLGRWVVDETKLVYRYQAPRNDFDGVLPKYDYGQWTYVLGCDLGYMDDTAVCVGAFHEHDKRLFILWAGKRPRLDITAVAAWVRQVAGKYPIDRYIVDGANKQAVMEMVNRHDIPWKAADKTGKSDFIEIMNGDFILGNIVTGPMADALKEEWQTLVWDEKAFARGDRVEAATLPNHACDAALYLWRHAYAYLSQPKAAIVPYGSRQWQDDEEKRMEAEADRQAREEERARLEMTEW